MSMTRHWQYVKNLVRWRRGAERVRASFPPLAADHVAGQGGCPLCPYRLGNGLRVVQLAVGPTNRDAARLHEAGWEYTAGAVLAHQPCANRFSPAELDIALAGVDFGALADDSSGAFEGQAPEPPADAGGSDTGGASAQVAFLHKG